MIYNCASHIGKVRKNNEDYCKGEIIDTDFGSVGIFALADGMGGHNKGEVASKLAVENIIEFFKENLLQSSNIKIDYIDDIIINITIILCFRFILSGRHRILLKKALSVFR